MTNTNQALINSINKMSQAFQEINSIWLDNDKDSMDKILEGDYPFMTDLNELNMDVQQWTENALERIDEQDAPPMKFVEKIKEEGFEIVLIHQEEEERGVKFISTQNKNEEFFAYGGDIIFGAETPDSLFDAWFDSSSLYSHEFISENAVKHLNIEGQDGLGYWSPMRTLLSLAHARKAASQIRFSDGTVVGTWEDTTWNNNTSDSIQLDIHLDNGELSIGNIDLYIPHTKNQSDDGYCDNYVLQVGFTGISGREQAFETLDEALTFISSQTSYEALYGALSTEIG